jgi:ABC-type transport system substrate-binding protein
MGSIADGKTIKQFTASNASRVLDVFLNFKNPQLADPNVRRALSMATDRATLASSIMSKTCTASAQPFAPGTVGYNPAVKRAVFDPAKAKTLLEKAGASRITLTMDVVGLPLYVRLATALQAEYEQIGVTVKLTTLPPAQAVIEWAKGNYDMFIYLQAGAPDPSTIISTYYAPHTPLAGVVLTNGGDAHIASLEQAARKLPLGSQDRASAYQDVSAYIANTPPAILLCNWPPSYLYRANVAGMASTPYMAMNVVADPVSLYVTKKG